MDLACRARCGLRPNALVIHCCKEPVEVIWGGRSRCALFQGRRSVQLARQHGRVDTACLSESQARIAAKSGPARVVGTDVIPILSGGGGGIFFFWQLGIVQYLRERYDLTKVEARGASAGALLATMMACNIDPRAALDLAHSLAEDARLWDRKLKLAGVWGGLIRAWLYGLLPPNAADLVRGRLKLVVTDVRARFKQVILEDFDNNRELVEANLASVHVPFFLDWQAFASFRGRPYVDGSLADFLHSNNSDLLTCEGRAVVLDYFQDDQLIYKCMDFLKLPSHAQAVDLMSKGYKYAERVDATGEYTEKLGAASW